jgi:hypothetical protein
MLKGCKMKYHIVMTSGRSYDILANTIAEAFRKADLLEIKTHDTVRLLAQKMGLMRTAE